MSTEIVFVTGGARSGKSTWALEQASGVEGKKLFIATAQAMDEEMSARIEAHKAERGREWDVCEEPLDISGAIGKNIGQYDVILVDCLTVWLSNIMMQKEYRIDETLLLLRSVLMGLQSRSGTSRKVILVSNEVGMGIVPSNALARSFRDHAGRVNQCIADIADTAVFVVSGLPLYLKK